jgi:hypothetical protein
VLGMIFLQHIDRPCPIQSHKNHLYGLIKN